MSTVRLFSPACLTLAVILASAAPLVRAANYTRVNPGAGSFTNSSLWSPHLPPLLSGPGDADDTVMFNLGVTPFNRYEVTGVAGENDRLLVGDDSLTLSVSNYKLLNSSYLTPSLALGLANDDRAEIVLTGGAASVLETESFYLGYAPLSSAYMVVDQLKWLSKGDAVIGNGGDGDLKIQNGGILSHAGNAWVAQTTASSGEITVTGPGSTLTTNDTLCIGRFGTGFLRVESGGTATSKFGMIGAEGGASGKVTVVGAGSTWTTSVGIRVGDYGSGSLEILNGGSVSSPNGAVGVHPGGSGHVLVSGAGSSWTTGKLSLGGEPIINAIDGQGAITINTGATVTVGGTTTILAKGKLTLNGGSFASSTMIFEGGEFKWLAGKVQVGLYDGSLTNQNGTLAPGGSLTGSTTIDGDYTQFSGGRLAIDVGGTAPGGSHDLVAVSGSAILGGQLRVSLVNDFVPAAGDAFTVFNAVGGLLGVFSNAASGQRLATEDGIGSFLVNYGLSSPFNPNQVVLTNFQLAGVPGDYNQDGTVDSADYVVWRKNAGTNNPLPNDLIGGVIGAAHYDQWRSHFGQTAGSGAALLSAQSLWAAVPEPASLVTLLLATIGMFAIPRCRFPVGSKLSGKSFPRMSAPAPGSRN